MSTEALIQKIDNTVVKMYIKDYGCDNANQQIYNALLYEYMMLRILAFEIDEEGVYDQAMEDILQKSIEAEGKATNVFMLIWNVRYAVFQTLEIIAALLDVSGTHLEKIGEIRRLFAENDEGAQNINQQIYYAADASYAMLSVVAEILDANGAYSDIFNSIADKYQNSNNNCSGIFQQAFCADRAFFETLQLVLTLVGGQGGLSMAESIEDRLNKNYEMSKGVFHDITFISHASVEALAFCTMGFAGEDLTKFELPNWKGAAAAERQAENNETSAPQPAAPSYEAAESTTSQSSPSSSTSSSGGCYVATCVYGSYDCPEVWTLRRYRDNTLGATWYGRAFVRLYYAISPTLVKWFGKTRWFKRLWRGKLDRMVAKLQSHGVENTPYSDKQW